MKTFLKIIKHRWFFPVLLFILIIPAFYFMLKPGIYWNMHDDMQMIRQLEMEKCLKDGQIPCRWTPDLGYGYGYPLFNFYPPLPYIIGQTFRTFGATFVTTVKLTAFSQIILSALFMYLLGAEFGGPVAGFLASLFYTYGPYHAVDIYVRGAMDEAWAAVFFPLIFLASYRLIKKPKLIYILLLSVSYCCLLLSHNPMVLIFTPFLVLWCFYWLFDQYGLKIKKYFSTLKNLAISGFFALSLAAFFTIPLAFETKYVQIASMFENYYFYAIHFVTFYQLFFSNFWGDGPSVWGPNDGLSFSIGYLHWIIPTIGILFSIYLLIRKSEKYFKLILPFLMLSLFGYFSAFMTHQKSYLIWQFFKILQDLQFPWRFLNLVNFFFSASIIFLYLIFSKLKIKSIIKNITIALIVLVLILINYQHFYPITSGPVTDQQKFSGLAWNNQITSGIYDYLPKTASTAAKAPAGDYVDAVSPSTAKYQISGAKKGTDWIFYNLDLSDNATVTLPMLAFPDFRLFDYGKPINYQIEPLLGRITVSLPSGSHQLFLKLYDTPIRTISDYWSLLAWLLFIFLIIKTTWKKSKFRK